MKWINIISSSKQEVYELCHGDNKLLSLTYRSDTGTARVQYDDEKRTFMIGKEGFLKSKTVLRNEYGIKIGQLEYEKWNSAEGIIDLNGENLHYSINNNAAELIIYKISKEQPLVRCGLTSSAGNSNIRFKKEDDLHHTIYPCLLMALCWFIFLPIAKENFIEYTL